MLLILRKKGEPSSSSSSGGAEADAHASDETVAASRKNIVNKDRGIPHSAIRGPRCTTRLQLYKMGGGDNETSRYAKLRYSAPAPTAGSRARSNIKWIDFVISGYESMSERHDRESHNVNAELSTGEKLTLYHDSYYEKYSSMQNGPGNTKDASNAGREKLAAHLSSLQTTRAVPVDLTSVYESGPDAAAFSFGSVNVLNLAKALKKRVM